MASSAVSNPWTFSPQIDPGKVELPVENGTPINLVVFGPPIVSAPIIPMPRMSGVCNALLALKSASGLAPRVLGAPPLVKIGQNEFWNLSQIARQRSSVSGLARPVAF